MTPGARPSSTGCDESEDIVAAKAILRSRAIALREAIAPSERAAMATAIAAAALPFLTGKSRVVSAYSPVGAELDIMPLVRRIAALGHRTALPVVLARGRPLVFRAWAPGDELEPGVRGIPVPAAAAPEVVPDILLVPLLMFDRRGYRLGYGGGFYDRTIAGLRAGGDVIAVGVGFSAQEVPAVPVAGYDARLDWLLTERGAVEVAPGIPA